MKHVAAGYGCALALRLDGTVWAWGYNDFGKLGEGTEEDQPTPVQLSGFSDIVALATAARASYALHSDGSVWAWGGNPFHELGAGPGWDRSMPASQSPVMSVRAMTEKEVGSRTAVRVHGLSQVTAIAAGGDRALALRSDGTVWAWGDNQRGRLGDGTTIEHLEPVQVTGLERVVAIAAGVTAAYAVREDRTVWSWGGNGNGQLGDGTHEDRLAPVQVLGLEDVAAIASGHSSAYAISSAGTLWAWGNNRHGQLGDGTQTDRAVPTPAKGPAGIRQLAAGWRSAYAIVDDGSVWAWGNNELGQLGDRDRAGRPVPKQVPGLSGIVAISARLDTVYALADSRDAHSGYAEPAQASMRPGQHPEPGSVWAWGSNYRADLGDGSREDRLTPVQVSGLSDVKDVSCSPSRGRNDGLTRALKTDGTVWAWGGRIVNGELEGNVTPTQVDVDEVTTIADGFAVKSDCSVWDLRVFYMDKDPAPVPGLADVKAVFPFAPLLYFTRTDGSVFVRLFSFSSWESRAKYEFQWQQHQLDALVNATAMISWEAACRFDVAVDGAGTVWEWSVGTVDGTPLTNGEVLGPLEAPRPLTGLTEVTSLVAGDRCAYALRADGTIWAWGTNDKGQLGDGTTESRTTPVMVVGLANVTAIDPLGASCFALKQDGTVWAWGDNEHGQLGDGTHEMRTSPVQVPGLDGITSLHRGFAVKNDGTAWVWGDNEHGRLADGTADPRTSPGQILGLAGVTAIAPAPSSWFAIIGGSSADESGSTGQ